MSPAADAPARTEEPSPPPLLPRVGLGRMFSAFLWLGGTSFGGGTAGWLYRDIVLKRGWLDDQAFLPMLALGQVMPGSNGVNLSVLIGQRLHGAAGAAAALFGLLLVPFAVVLAIAAAYAGIGGQPLVQHMLDGVAAAVVGLTFATGMRGVARGAPGPSALTVAAATVLSVGVLRWPIVPVIAVLGPASIGLALIEPRLRRRRR